MAKQKFDDAIHIGKHNGPFRRVPVPGDIDWESRRWQAAVAAMQGLLASPNAIATKDIAFAVDALAVADALIAGFRKQETTNAR